MGQCDNPKQLAVKVSEFPLFPFFLQESYLWLETVQIIQGTSVFVNSFLSFVVNDSPFVVTPRLRSGLKALVEP
jgi:hypothetical protein